MASVAAWARSPRPAIPTRAGCWSKRSGTSAGCYGRASRSCGRRQGQSAAVRVRADASGRRLHARLGSSRRTRQAAHDRRRRRRSRAGRPLLGVGDDGVTAHRQRLGEGSAPAQKDARSDRGTATSSPSQATLDSREQLRSSPRTTRSCGPDPRISAPTRRVDETAYALPHRNKEGPANTGLHRRT